MPDWKVPGYTELKALGSGGFGEVMLARHDASGVLVAIKYLRHDLLADPGFTGMFRGEAAVLASLEDPNIVRLYEYVESPAGAAIVMELIDGVSLREILVHQGSTAPEAALVVLQGSLLGLAAAHQRGVVHRDYKPDNVLVDGGGLSKLTDFGLAVRAGDRPVPAGTLTYVAPEQIAGAPASPAGDVYSATATFYQCLTGRPPFSGESAELLRQHRTEPVPLDPVPAPLRPLVAAGMAKDPQHRPADAITFVTELQTVASGAYGKDWEKRGRSHLGEAALLLTALWPSGAPPAAQGTTVHRISLRHIAPVKAAIAAGAAVIVVAAGTALGREPVARTPPPQPCGRRGTPSHAPAGDLDSTVGFGVALAAGLAPGSGVPVPLAIDPTVNFRVALAVDPTVNFRVAVAVDPAPGFGATVTTRRYRVPAGWDWVHQGRQVSRSQRAAQQQLHRVRGHLDVDIRAALLLRRAALLDRWHDIQERRVLHPHPGLPRELGERLKRPGVHVRGQR